MNRGIQLEKKKEGARGFMHPRKGKVAPWCATREDGAGRISLLRHPGAGTALLSASKPRAHLGTVDERNRWARFGGRSSVASFIRQSPVVVIAFFYPAFNSGGILSARSAIRNCCVRSFLTLKRRKRRAVR
jgi:hypothetical protein